jgi:hypothetical protein
VTRKLSRLLVCFAFGGEDLDFGDEEEGMTILVVEMLVVIQILVMNQLRVKSLLMNQLLLSQRLLLK